MVRIWVRTLVSVALICFNLLACSSKDVPFTLADQNQGPQNPITTPPPGNAPETPGSGDGCQIDFDGTVNFKISVARTTENLEEDLTVNLEQPIVIGFSGSQVSITSFPTLFIRPEADAGADLKVEVDPNANPITGDYDAASGTINLNGLVPILELVVTGTTNPIEIGTTTLPAIDFTTSGPLTINGNLNSLTLQGSSLQSDGSLTLVGGITLPQNDFGPLPLADTLGGGALGITFDLTGATPENCPSGDGDGDGDSGEGGTPPPSTVSSIPNLKVEVQAANSNSSLNFQSLVRTHLVGQSEEVLCAPANLDSRIQDNKIITMTNEGSAAMTLDIVTRSTDSDTQPSPGCASLRGEFFHNQPMPENGASCGVNWPCTVPPGAKVTFAASFLPMNFVADGNGEVSDQGELVISNDNGESHTIQLNGITAVDQRGDFSVTLAEFSTRKILNGGLLKIAMASGATTDSQDFILKNLSTKNWQVQANLESGDDFSVTGLTGGTLPAGNGDAGQLAFAITCSPSTSDKVLSDKLNISLTNNNTTFDLSYNVACTLGAREIVGKWNFVPDFLTLFVKGQIQLPPIASLDFRQNPNFRLHAQRMTFGNLNSQGIRDVTFTSPIDLQGIVNANSQDGQKRALRVFTSTASLRADDNEIDSIEDCQLFDNINQPYQAGGCSFYYFALPEVTSGFFDELTGDFYMPEMPVSIVNPFHGNVSGAWCSSNPNAQPDCILDSPFTATWTTGRVDALEFNEAGLNFPLVPASNSLSLADLDLSDKNLGEPCPENFLESEIPNINCFISPNGKYMQGIKATPRPGHLDQYYIAVTAAIKLRDPSSHPQDQIPIFLANRDTEGATLYLVLYGRLCPEDPNDPDNYETFCSLD